MTPKMKLLTPALMSFISDVFSSQTSLRISKPCEDLVKDQMMHWMLILQTKAVQYLDEFIDGRIKHKQRKHKIFRK